MKSAKEFEPLLREIDRDSPNLTWAVAHISEWQVAQPHSFALSLMIEWVPIF